MTVPPNEDLQNRFKMVLHWYSHTNLKPLGNAALSLVSTPVRDTFYSQIMNIISQGAGIPPGKQLIRILWFQ